MTVIAQQQMGNELRESEYRTREAEARLAAELGASEELRADRDSCSARVELLEEGFTLLVDELDRAAHDPLYVIDSTSWVTAITTATTLPCGSPPLP